MNATMNVTRIGWQTLALVVIVGLISVPAMSQPPGPPPPGGPGGPPHGPPHSHRHGPPHGGPAGGMGMLLRMEEVQVELGLTEGQMTELKALGSELREKFGKKMRARGERRGGPGAKGRKGQGKQGSGNKGPGKKGPGAREGRGPGAGGPPDREEMREKMRAHMKEARAEVEGRLAEILSEEQMTRLKEIGVQAQLQRGGPHALLRGPLGDELALSDDQKTDLHERAKELRGEMVEKIQALRKETHAQLLDVLTSEQREKLDTMRGEDFDLPAPPRFDKRGGRRSGRDCGPDGCRKGGPPRGGRGPGGPPAS